MRKSYIYIIGATMLLTPASALAQASLSPRTAIAVASPTLLKSPAAQAAAVGVASSQLSAYVTIDPALTSWQQLGVTPITENVPTRYHNHRPTFAHQEVRQSHSLSRTEARLYPFWAGECHGQDQTQHNVLSKQTGRRFSEH